MARARRASRATALSLAQRARRRRTPAKIETVVQTDVHTLVLGLRTMTRSGHLYLCWHPNAARVCMGRAPERKPDADTFSYGEVMRKLVKGLALCDLVMAPWERVVQLRLAARPVSRSLLWWQCDPRAHCSGTYNPSPCALRRAWCAVQDDGESFTLSSHGQSFET
jgi:hypothetical protein